MNNGLRRFFPMLRERCDILEEIRGRELLLAEFESWPEKRQEEFLDFCTGVKGIKILYDTFFKED